MKISACPHSIDNPLSYMDYPPFLQEDLDPPFHEFSKIPTAYKWWVGLCTMMMMMIIIIIIIIIIVVVVVVVVVIAGMVDGRSS